MRTFRARWRARARQLRQEIYALILAYRDPRLPWYYRLLLLGLLSYAFSPIDLIPDCIPVIGSLDDLVILPLGILLAIKLLPPALLEESRARARAALAEEQSPFGGGVFLVLALWAFGLLLLLLLFWVLSKRQFIVSR
ncbi:YkvA family protein [Thermogemmatispora sp.]|uniref:YkvA family protein n=1 Tax=Thermogemmatispora sp. TaxID=1968838 RepID=UPI0035E414CA